MLQKLKIKIGNCYLHKYAISSFITSILNCHNGPTGVEKLNTTATPCVHNNSLVIEVYFIVARGIRFVLQ